MMNPFAYSMLVLAGVVGVAILLLTYRDLIFDTPPPRRQVRGRRPVRRRPAPAGRPKGVETDAKINETISKAISGAATPNSSTEMISFHTLAKLVHAGVVTETTAIETACGVIAGSSKDYQEAREKFKRAAAELDTTTEAKPRSRRKR